MIFEGQESHAISIYHINQAIFCINAPRPSSLIVIFERFWFPIPEKKDRVEYLWLIYWFFLMFSILVLPIAIIRPGIFCKLEQHSLLNHMHLSASSTNLSHSSQDLVRKFLILSDSQGFLNTVPFALWKDYNILVWFLLTTVKGSNSSFTFFM